MAGSLVTSEVPETGDPKRRIVWPSGQTSRRAAERRPKDTSGAASRLTQPSKIDQRSGRGDDRKTCYCQLLISVLGRSPFFRILPEDWPLSATLATEMVEPQNWRNG